MSSFELEREETADSAVVLVHVIGEVDLTNARELEERLEALSPGDDTTLALDLNRVVFVDSAALHVLFRVSRRLGKHRFGLVLEPTAPIARTLGIVGLLEGAAVEATADDLLTALGRR